jgi:hypothetical protein
MHHNGYIHRVGRFFVPDGNLSFQIRKNWPFQRARVLKGVMLVSLTGPFSLFSYKNQCYLLGFQGSALLVSIVSLPLQVGWE